MFLNRYCRRGTFVLTAMLGACSSNGDTAAISSEFCSVIEASAALPAELHESSGVALSRTSPGVLWSHNDSGGDAEVFAVELPGILNGRIPVAGAENRDWEDIALGKCPTGECLYIADIGDNSGQHESVTIYRVPEPKPTATTTEQAEQLIFTYPGGPRDAEAVFVTTEGELYVVSKGREGPAALYHYPSDAQPGETVELEHVRDLSAGPLQIPDQVTAAGANPDGNWIAIRTYSTLHLYRTENLLDPSATLDPRSVDLTALDEGQGEGVDIRGNGVVVMTSEGEPPTASVLKCSVR